MTLFRCGLVSFALVGAAAAAAAATAAAAAEEEEKLQHMAKGASFVPALRAAATAGGGAVDCASVGAWHETTSDDLNDLDYHAPTMHSAEILDSLKRNHRPFYRDLGAALSRDDGDTVRRMLLRDPYDGVAAPALEPVPSVCALRSRAGGPTGRVTVGRVTVGPLGVVCVDRSCISLKACGSGAGRDGQVTPYEVVVRAGTAVSLAQPFHAHFHFVAEILPRLALLSEHLGSTSLRRGGGGQHQLHLWPLLDDVLLHFGAIPVSDAMVETVALVLGAKHSDRIRERIVGGARTRIAFDTLIVPEPVGCGSPSRMMLLGFQRHMLNRRSTNTVGTMPAAALPAAATGASYNNIGGRMAILLRRDGRVQHRAIQNHHELARALTETTAAAGLALRVFGNKDAASMPLVDQARLFARADLVVGAHGAGLVNVLHLRRGSFVVEILPTRSQALTCYLHMSAKLGLRYHAMIAEEEDAAGSLVVPVEAVAAVVAGLGRIRMPRRIHRRITAVRSSQEL